MLHADRWTPSKYLVQGDRLVGSRDTKELGVGSRLIADAVAARYGAALPRYARGRLVDLGCGKVPLYAAYRGLVDEVTCVDWGESAHASPHVDRLADLGAPLPFEGGAFETAICSDVLEHVPSPELLVEEIARILVPGGHLLLNVPFLYGIHEAPHDYARYTEFALRRFMSRAGFEVVALETIGGSVHVLADLLAKHLARAPLVGHALAAALQGAVSMLDRTAWGRRVAATSGTRFPLGYFVVARRPVEPVRAVASASTGATSVTAAA